MECRGYVKNHVYNQTVCVPSEGGICTICESEFASCPHANGTVYGGEVCSVSEQCNICGNDYFNGDVCHLKESHMWDSLPAADCFTK